MQKVTFPYLINIQCKFYRKQAVQILKYTGLEIKVEVFGPFGIRANANIGKIGDVAVMPPTILFLLSYLYCMKPTCFSGVVRVAKVERHCASRRWCITYCLRSNEALNIINVCQRTELSILKRYIVTSISVI